MGKPHTKSDIMLIAIDLFSAVGYINSTMRELAKCAGLRPASLYYHYESKDKLLEEIFDFFISNDAKYRKTTNNLYDLAANGSVEQVLDAITFTYANDDEFATMIKILRIAIGYQFENKKAKEVFNYIFYDMALANRESIFTELIEKGIYEAFDCETISYILTSYSMMLFMENHSAPMDEFIDSYNNGMRQVIKTVSPLIKKRASPA